MKSTLHIQPDLQQHPKHQLLECLCQKFAKLLDGFSQILLESFLKRLIKENLGECLLYAYSKDFEDQ